MCFGWGGASFEHLFEKQYGGVLAIGERWEWCCVGWVTERFGEVVDSGQDEIVRGALWHDDRAWEPCKGIGNPFGGCFACPHAVATVMSHRWAKVPTADCMWIPRASNWGLLVDHDFSPRRCNGGVVEVKGTMNLRVG